MKVLDSENPSPWFVMQEDVAEYEQWIVLLGKVLPEGLTVSAEDSLMLYNTDCSIRMVMRYLNGTIELAELTG